jgi:hypothetical protein
MPPPLRRNILPPEWEEVPEPPPDLPRHPPINGVKPVNMRDVLLLSLFDFVRGDCARLNAPSSSSSSSTPPIFHAHIASIHDRARDSRTQSRRRTDRTLACPRTRCGRHVLMAARSHRTNARRRGAREWRCPARSSIQHLRGPDAQIRQRASVRRPRRRPTSHEPAAAQQEELDEHDWTRLRYRQVNEKPRLRTR